METAVEKRLSLKGGSTLTEISADLVNRFQNGLEKIRKDKHEEAEKLHAKIRGMEKRTPTAVEKMEELEKEKKALIEEGSRLWRNAKAEKAREYDGPILAYIQKVHGKIKRNKLGDVTHFGNLQYIDGHFRKPETVGVSPELDKLIKAEEDKPIT
jgi:Zn-dependent M32 family carboxypeptidase